MFRDEIDRFALKAKEPSTRTSSWIDNAKFRQNLRVPFRPEKQSTMLEVKINILSNEKKIRRRKRRIDVKLNGRVKRNYLNNFYIKTFFESLFQNIHEFPCSTETN